MKQTRSAASGASRLNKSASAADTKILESNVCATQLSNPSKRSPSRRYNQLSGQDLRGAYCRHLSESTSTKSTTRRREAYFLPMTYWAMGDEYTNSRCTAPRIRME